MSSRSRASGDNRREGQASHFIDDRKFRGKNSRPMKGYSEEMAPPTRRKRRKTVKLWKDPSAVERGRKGAEARKANAGKRAAQSEHERRSEAARKGWAKIPAAERTRRAERGWETRDRRNGRSRSREDAASRARDYKQHPRKPGALVPYPGAYRGGNEFPF